METVNSLGKEVQTSKTVLWIGRIISAICVLFLIVDAVMKIAITAPAMEGSLQLGWPESAVQSIGIVLLLNTILYCIPRTRILGAILLTGYLGGATSIMVRVMLPGHPYLLPVIFGVMVWAGLFLQDARLRTLIPFRRS